MRIPTSIAALGLLLSQAGQLSAADLITAIETPMPPPPEERGIWAAIAFSEIDVKHGFFWGADKRQEAIDNAMQHCENAGGNACKVVEVFRNRRHWNDDDKTGFPYHHCGALAVANKPEGGLTRWSTKSAVNRQEAEEKARQACESNGNQECKIHQWVCT